MSIFNIQAMALGSTLVSIASIVVLQCVAVGCACKDFFLGAQIKKIKHSGLTLPGSVQENLVKISRV